MTKQEKIKEAYGSYSDTALGLCDENGWIKLSEYYTYFPQDSQKSSCGWFERPKKLKGIEDNNGWIKIENKLDLPIERGYYFVIMNGKKSIMGYAPEYQKWIGGGHYYFEPHGNLNLTHYQPISFPEDNIY